MTFKYQVGKQRPGRARWRPPMRHRRRSGIPASGLPPSPRPPSSRSGRRRVRAGGGAGVRSRRPRVGRVARRPSFKQIESSLRTEARHDTVVDITALGASAPLPKSDTPAVAALMVSLEVQFTPPTRRPTSRRLSRRPEPGGGAAVYSVAAVRGSPRERPRGRPVAIGRRSATASPSPRPRRRAGDRGAPAEGGAPLDGESPSMARTSSSSSSGRRRRTRSRRAPPPPPRAAGSPPGPPVIIVDHARPRRARLFLFGATSASASSSSSGGRDAAPRGANSRSAKRVDTTSRTTARRRMSTRARARASSATASRSARSTWRCKAFFSASSSVCRTPQAPPRRRARTAAGSCAGPGPSDGGRASPAAP